MTATSKFVANDPINMLIVVYLTFLISLVDQVNNKILKIGIQIIWMKTKYYKSFTFKKNPILFSYVNKYV